MKITNEHNLPPIIVAAITKGMRPRKPGRYSVTEITSPPLLTALQRLNYDRITVDASEFLWRLYGSNVHYTLERAAEDDDISATCIPEMHMEVNLDDGRTVSGIFDLLEMRADEAVLWDFKTTSVWAAKNMLEGGKNDWDVQANIYAWMAHKHGQKIDRIRFAIIIRDWRRNECLQYGRPYPPIPYMEIETHVWADSDATEVYIKRRLDMIEENMLALEEGLYPPHPCSPEDRWMQPTIYAVHKVGNKRAVRGGLKDTEAEALQMVEDLTAKTGKPHEVQVRPGRNVRCETCEVAQFCPMEHVRAMLEKNNG